MSTVKGLGSLPTTIEAALQPSTEARVITEPDEPFRIVHVNEMWCKASGYDAEEVLGQTCKFLHGPGTCAQTLTMLKQGLQLKRGLAVQLLNYTKGGRPFMNTLQVAPLYDTSGKVTHYLGVIMARYLDAQPAAVPSAQPQQMGHAATGPVTRRQVEVGATGPATRGSLAAATAPCTGTLATHGMPMPTPLGGVGGGGGFGGEEGSGGGLALCGDGGGGGGGSSVDGDDDGTSSISRVPPFLTKLTEILTVESPEVVGLNVDVASFTIGDPQRFAKEVLPRYFKHNKLGSFYQQLHTYGFRRASSAPDSAVEFHHDQYMGSPEDFAEWIRLGGAVSKRTVPLRVGGESATSPPPQLLHDMLQVHEGMRQIAYHFQQAKAMHSVQLRTILQKLVVRGLLNPESAAYISSLPPATPLPGQTIGAQASFPGLPGGMPPANAPAAVGASTTAGLLPGGPTSLSPGPSAAELAATLNLPFPGGGLLGRGTHDALQAQLDALEAGLLAPLGPLPAEQAAAAGAGGHSGELAGEPAAAAAAVGSCSVHSGERPSGHPWPCGGGAPPGVPLMHAASDLQGDEALSLFADNSPYSHPDEGSRGSGHPYPVGAAGHATLAASAGSPQPMETTAEG